MTTLGLTPRHQREQEFENERTPDMPGLPTLFSAALKVGLPVALCVYLIWWATARADSYMQQTRDLLQQHEAASSAARVMMIEHVHSTAEIKVLLMRICANTAKTDQQRNDCFR